MLVHMGMRWSQRPRHTSVPATQRRGLDAGGGPALPALELLAGVQAVGMGSSQP